MAACGEHAELAPGTVIMNRYQVLHELGHGNFSKVYACKDICASNVSERDATVAVKLIKREFASDAKFEINILRAITTADKTHREKILHVKDYFIWNNFPCFVFERKGRSLRNCRLGIKNINQLLIDDDNSETVTESCTSGTTREEVQSFARQMLGALRFLHLEMNIVHTDLKPDNILLDNPNTLEQLNGSVTSTNNFSGIGDGWTIVDFGSASFCRMDDLDSDLISTRPYRGPEVILGEEWYYPADIWSMGCILYEVYTGRVLFDAVDDDIHLSLMEEKLGKPPKEFILGSTNRYMLYDNRCNLLQPFDVNNTSYDCRHLAEELSFDPQFADLLLQMLQYEPKKRLSADNALSHPFLSSTRLDNSLLEGTVNSSLINSKLSSIAPATEMHMRQNIYSTSIPTNDLTIRKDIIVPSETAAAAAASATSTGISGRTSDDFLEHSILINSMTLTQKLADELEQLEKLNTHNNEYMNLNRRKKMEGLRQKKQFNDTESDSSDSCTESPNGLSKHRNTSPSSEDEQIATGVDEKKSSIMTANSPEVHSNFDNKELLNKSSYSISNSNENITLQKTDPNLSNRDNLVNITRLEERKLLFARKVKKTSLTAPTESSFDWMICFPCFKIK